MQNESEVKMNTVIRISKNIVEKARIRSKAENRSLAGQIEYWIKIGKIAEENPELSFAHIYYSQIGFRILFYKKLTSVSLKKRENFCKIRKPICFGYT